MRAEPVPSLQGIDPHRFWVRMVECTKVGTREVQTVADFEDGAAAEAFIRSKVGTGKKSGFNAGRHWGENTAGDQVCYWIETDQETAAVKSALL